MPFERRGFLKTVSVGAVGLGAATSLLGPNSAKADMFNANVQEPLQTGTRPNFRLGSAAYSFKPHFECNNCKAQKPLDGKPIDMFGFVDFGAE